MLFDPNWTPPAAPKVIKKKQKSKRKTWRSLMLKAADILERTGWIQGDLYRTGQGFCTLGALTRADGAGLRKINDNPHSNSKSKMIAEDKLLTYLLNHTRDYEIVYWNDNPLRTKEQVIQTLRTVAKQK